MKQIERAPKWFNEQLYKEINKLRLNEDFLLLLNEINEKYLYWDKVKYHTNTQVSDPKTLWAAVKLSRTINAKKIQFGENNFIEQGTCLITKNVVILGNIIFEYGAKV